MTLEQASVEKHDDHRLCREVTDHFDVGTGATLADVHHQHKENLSRLLMDEIFHVARIFRVRNDSVTE